MPYVATRPDPLTVLLDFRNVDADGVANSVVAEREESDRRRVGRSGRVARRAGLARAHRAGAAGRASRAQRPQHRRRRLRQAVGDGAPYVLPPAARDGRARRDAGAAERAAPVDPIAALGLDAGAGAAPTAAPCRGRAAPRPAPAALPAAQPQRHAARRRRRSRRHRISRGAARPAAQFTGNPISLDFQGADLRAVLRTFAEISGLNIVIDPAVQGTVDVALRDVPWDQALDIILRANKLGYIVDGTIVRIAPLDGAGRRGRRSAASWPRSRRSPASCEVLTKTLSYAQGRGAAGAADQERAVAARHRPGRPAHQHADHHRPARIG